MQIWRLELEHFMNALLVDFVRSFADLISSPIGSSKSSLDQLFAVFVQKVKGVQVRAGRDLDQLRKTVSYLSGR